MPIQLAHLNDAQDNIQNQGDLVSMQSNRSELSGISDNNIDEDIVTTPRIRRREESVAKD